MRPDDRRADERRLASGAMAALGVVAVPVIPVAGLTAGWPGVVGAAAGLGLVAVLFAGSAAVLGWVGRRRPASAAGFLVGGAVGRVTFYLVALAALAQVHSLHRTSLAAATAIAVAATLAVELRLLARMPRLFWVDAATRPQAVPTATGSQPL